MIKLTFLKSVSFLFVLSVILTSCQQKQSNEQEDNKKPEGNAISVSYNESADPSPIDESLWADIPQGLHGSFGTPDERYPKHLPIVTPKNMKWNATGWKGERIHTQVVLWTKEDEHTLTYEIGGFKDQNGATISANQTQLRFVKYVLTDEFSDGCGKRNKEDYAVSLVADVLDIATIINMENNSVRPVWVSIDIPENTISGTYLNEIKINSSKGDQVVFNIELTVQDQVLPQPSEWSYHLDLWQNPYAVARVHNVKAWSDEHWGYLEPMLKMLASAGQKCVTTSIIHHPWDGQTVDPFDEMIKWTKKTDGSWEYDYSVFDRWVEFAEKCGITQQINCYSMVPWHMRFRYFNEATNSFEELETKTGTEEFNNHWRPFLQNFWMHLKEKNWQDKTVIAMDERPMEAMKSVIKLIKETSPDLKIALAGEFHEEIQDDIFDLCVASKEIVPKEDIMQRNKKGNFTTYYTCCVEAYPNNFTFSPPAESAWQGWYAASKGFDGYLRWAYNSWVKEPLLDSRFRTWPAGDTYMVYPGARSSIRFERIREGIQDYEKIRILKEKLSTDKLEELNNVLATFKLEALSNQPAGEMVNKGKDVINKISEELN